VEKSLFEQMGGKYSQVGDYLLPNLTSPDLHEETLLFGSVFSAIQYLFLVVQ